MPALRNDSAARRLKLRGLGLGLLLLAGLAGGARAYDLANRNGYVYTWDPGTITMQLKLPPSAAPLADGNASYNASVLQAMQVWNGVVGAVRFAGQEAAVGVNTEGNGLSEIVLNSTVDGDAFPERTLAITVNYSAGDVRTESDIVFNSGYTFDSYRGNTRTNPDIQRVAIHELGHVLGLNHPDEAGQTVTAIMNSTITNVQTVQTDDIGGAQTLYGAPGFVPANNNFASATTILLSGTSAQVAGSNVMATKEAGEPNHAAGEAGGRSVWWRWVAPGNGRTTVTTQGSNFDTLLAVYTGSAVSALTSLGSNDDVTRGVVRTSSVAFDAVGGTTYYFAVDGWSGRFGVIQLNVGYVSTGGTPPVITTQPASQTVTAGGAVTFNVVASGSPTSYQWFFNSAPISGATGVSFTLTNVQSADAGTYTVAVSNSAGTVVSSAATLTVNAVVSIPTPSTGSSGGGGGGGAPSVYFLTALAGAALARWLARRFRA